MTDQKTKVEIDENTGLINTVFEDEEETKTVEKQLWGKNPSRVHALRDLWYEELVESLKDDKTPEEGKKELLFMMTSNSLLDLIMDVIPEETALELACDLDNMVAVALANKKYDVDLMEEYQKAMMQLKREDFKTDEEFTKSLEELSEHWWSISQPALGKRCANDVVLETLSKYGLND